MNKNTSMSYYFNKITDMIKNRVYVDSGPLESPTQNIKKEIQESNGTGNEVKKFPLFKDLDSDVVSEPITTNKKSTEVLNINALKQEDNQNSDFNLLPSESTIHFEEKIFVRIDDCDYQGQLVLTDYRLKFMPNEKVLKLSYKNPFPNYQSDFFDFPIFMIKIFTKDNRHVRLLCENENKKLFGLLAQCVNSKDISIYLNASVKYREYHPVNNDGWLIYDPINEFLRQGLELDEKDIKYENKFRLSFVNKNFDLCTSYPEIFVVPRNISDDDLKESASFRTKGRIPVLCYYNKENATSIWRSSQTRSGLTSQRNERDEKLLSAIWEVNGNKSTSSKKPNLIIYDARPYLNALANRFKGAGFENTDYYKNSEICFCEIDNIHCVRTSFIKLNTLISNKLSDNKNYLSQLEATNWLNFIYQILKSAVDIANSVKKGHSVLIHCSDGWDRSSQLTSLSQLLIDPYYRTLEGFMVLIEKEWLSFGHQFGLRNGLYNTKEHSEDQRAPIFLQWLDCVHQLIFNFPQLFEFNNELLIFLAYHLNSCKYGSFLFNCELERQEKQAKNKTVSIWTDLLEGNSRKVFLNPFYIPENEVKYLLPNLNCYKIRMWEEYFFRYSLCTRFLHIKTDKSKRKANSVYTSIKSNLVTKPKLQTNFQFVEMEKLKDLSVIKEQKEEIEKLNIIIKELSTNLILKVSDYNILSQETKEVIQNVNKLNGEVVEEDGYVLVKNKTLNDY